MDKHKFKSKISDYSLTRNIVTLITVLVAVSIGAMTLVAQRNHSQNLIDKESTSLKHDTQIIDNLFSGSIEKLNNDVVYLSWAPPIQGIIRAKQNNGVDPKDKSTYEQWVNRLNILFLYMLDANNDYYQGYEFRR